MLRNKDLDVKIMVDLDEKDFMSLCSVNKYTQGLCQSDTVYINRLHKNYPDVIQYKPEFMSWKKFYLKALYYILKLKEEYKFIYLTGNPLIYYKILNTASEGKEIFVRAGERCYIDLISISVDSEGIYKFDDLPNEIVAHFSGKCGLDFIKEVIESSPNEIDHSMLHEGLNDAAKYNNVPVFKYLFQFVKNKNENHLLPLRAGQSGNQEIIDMLIDYGYSDEADYINFLSGAILGKHHNLTKFFIEKVDLTNKGTRIDIFLLAATKNNLFVVKKIKQIPEETLKEALNLSLRFGTSKVSKHLIKIGVKLSNSEVEKAIQEHSTNKIGKINNLMDETF
jgi:hypothetical protein